MPNRPAAKAEMQRPELLARRSPVLVAMVVTADRPSAATRRQPAGTQTPAAVLAVTARLDPAGMLMAKPLARALSAAWLLEAMPQEAMLKRATERLAAIPPGELVQAATPRPRSRATGSKVAAHRIRVKRLHLAATSSR
jgi:hypothetical protein